MIETMEDDELVFAEEEESPVSSNIEGYWKLLIVDDEKEIHNITKLAISHTVFEKKKLHILNAYSGKEAREIIRDNPDIALILLDVVMEEEDAGLKLVKYIREDLQNSTVRIVLRTGQPGMAPEEKVIIDYDINDYKSKTDLTVARLFTTIIASLRSYRDLVMIEKSKLGLQKIIEASSSIFQLQSMDKLISGVLTQLISLLNLSDNSFFCTTSGFATSYEAGHFYVVAGTGDYENKVKARLSDISNPEISEALATALKTGENIFLEDRCIIFFSSEEKTINMVCIEYNRDLNDFEKNLIELYAKNALTAFHNILLLQLIVEKELESQKIKQEKLDVQERLSRYVGYQIAQEIIDQNIELKGERKKVTILFCDIRSFTEISETLEAEEVVIFLNQYFGHMVDTVFEHGGTLDKFIGDGIMAVYGVPISHGRDEEMAVRSALKMRQLVSDLNKKRLLGSKREIKIGVGIHSGEVIAGNIGSDKRMEYTVVGKAVNIASRIESLNKEFGTDILITEEVYSKVKDFIQVEKKEPVLVKGVATPITTYHILSADI